MAVLKHIAVQNADYCEAQRYLIFKHDEKNGKPILNENGNMLLRAVIFWTAFTVMLSLLIQRAWN